MSFDASAMIAIIADEHDGARLVVTGARQRRGAAHRQSRSIETTPGIPRILGLVLFAWVFSCGRVEYPQLFRSRRLQQAVIRTDKGECLCGDRAEHEAPCQLDGIVSA